MICKNPFGTNLYTAHSQIRNTQTVETSSAQLIVKHELFSFLMLLNLGEHEHFHCSQQGQPSEFHPNMLFLATRIWLTLGFSPSFSGQIWMPANERSGDPVERSARKPTRFIWKIFDFINLQKIISCNSNQVILK